ALEIAWSTRPAKDRRRGSTTDPPLELRQSAVGRPAHPGRAALARPRPGRIDRGQVYEPPSRPAAVADLVASRGFRVVPFEFPYMASRRTGKRKPSDRQDILMAMWLGVVELLGSTGLVIGKKSMGGRNASLITDEASVDGLVCLGYPFHPVGKP